MGWLSIKKRITFEKVSTLIAIPSKSATKKLPLILFQVAFIPSALSCFTFEKSITSIVTINSW